MVGQGKWRVINGKWMTPPTSASATTDKSSNSRIPDSLFEDVSVVVDEDVGGVIHFPLITLHLP